MLSTSVSEPLPSDRGSGIAVLSVTLKLLGPAPMSAAVWPVAVPS